MDRQTGGAHGSEGGDGQQRGRTVEADGEENPGRGHESEGQAAGRGGGDGEGRGRGDAEGEPGGQEDERIGAGP